MIQVPERAAQAKGKHSSFFGAEGVAFIAVEAAKL
jgi:hypothetical protein